MAEKIFLGDGEKDDRPWIEIRDLSSADRRWWRLLLEERDEGRPPAEIKEPDIPDHPERMRTVPNPDYKPVSMASNYELWDTMAKELLCGWSFPHPPDYPFTEEHPFTRGYHKLIPLDYSENFDAALFALHERLVRGGPKPRTAGATSASTSQDAEATPLPESGEKTSVTPSGSSGDSPTR